MKHACKKIVAVVSALSVLFCTFSVNAAHTGAERSALGAFAACAGHTLGTFSGVPACVSKDGDLHICANNFPDDIFRAYVANKDGAEDGYFTPKECGNITEVVLYEKGIKSLQGVEFFTNLINLRCSNRRGWGSSAYNRLTALDVSNNTALECLECEGNELTSLDVSSNTALNRLECSATYLTELDVSKNTALTSLSCYTNQLTELDVSKNTALNRLECGDNQLTELDVSRHTDLESLDCYGNQLTELDVSKNTALEYLSCSYNQLTELDVSNNTDLWSLSCENNQLTELDVTNCTELKYLYSFPQTRNLPLVKSGSVWTVDLGSLLADRGNITRIDPNSLSRGNLDWSTGLVTFTEKPESFTYAFSIGYEDWTMEVMIHLTDPDTTHKATINGTEYAYEVGEQVSITADAFYTDKGYAYRFDKWEGSVDIADAAASATTFTMPAEDVTISSCYYLIGDTDGNGVIDAMDAYDIIQMAVNKKTPTLVGDITGSGAVDAMSVANIAKYIVGTYIPSK